MEKGDKGSTMIWMGVSWWMFLLVPAYPGCPGSKAVKRSLLLLLLLWMCRMRSSFTMSARETMRSTRSSWKNSQLYRWGFIFTWHCCCCSCALCPSLAHTPIVHVSWHLQLRTWMILLMQSFTACTPLLTATSAFPIEVRPKFKYKYSITQHKHVSF